MMLISFDRLLKSFNQRMQRNRRKPVATTADIQELEPRALLAGAVSVVTTGFGDLRITGDQFNGDELHVTIDAAGLTIEGLNGTTINGDVAPFVISRGHDLDGLRDVIVNMKGGNDKVYVDVRESIKIGRSLAVDMGQGNDLFYIGVASGAVLTVGHDVLVTLGAGNDVFGAVAEDSEGDPGISVGRFLTVSGGSGDDLIGLHNAKVVCDLIVISGSGNDDVVVDGIDGRDDLLMFTGSGNDRVGVANVSIADITILNTSFGFDHVNVDTAHFGKDVRVQLGFNDDDLVVGAVDLADGTKATLDGGAGEDQITDVPADHDVKVRNFETDAPDSPTADDLLALVEKAGEHHLPVFTSSSTPSVPENTTAVITATATDDDIPMQTVTFSITGGMDSDQFSITPAGVLTFKAAPDFEHPTDVGVNNVYKVEVTADDGNGGTTVQKLAVAVTPVTATDADLPAQTVSFSITGGADAAKFSITSAGVLTFKAAPDFENATDAGADNVYNVVVTATDSGSPALSSTQSITVTVTPVEDNDPVITSNGGGAIASISLVENTTNVTTVTATAADKPGDTLTFSISGGADFAKFVITT